MKKFIVIILICMIGFNGLVNERELNKLAIVSCVGIDICDDGKYQVTVNVLDTKKRNLAINNLIIIAVLLKTYTQQKTKVYKVH